MFIEHIHKTCKNPLYYKSIYYILFYCSNEFNIYINSLKMYYNCNFILLLSLLR